MFFKRQILCFTGAIGLCVALAGAGDDDTKDLSLDVATNQSTVMLRQTAMPELREGRLARILTRHYEKGLGGAENWDRISSLKVRGILKVKSGEYVLSAYRKKPNLIKMNIEGHHLERVLAYDGKTAWQHRVGRDTEPEPMNETEARRFVHRAQFGNHLLHPFAEGKTIRYIDTVPTGGRICHQLRVTLNSGYQVDYFIDIRSYLEVKVIHTDLRSGAVDSVVYKDYCRKNGMPIARQVESFEEGQWVSSLTVHEIKVNAGIIPWMFKMRR